MFFLNNIRIYFLGQRKRGRVRARGTEDLRQALCWQMWGADVGLEITNREVTTRAKVGHATD